MGIVERDEGVTKGRGDRLRRSFVLPILGLARDAHGDEFGSLTAPGSSSRSLGTGAVASIVAKNYLSFARVLGESLRRHNTDVPFHALLTDEVDGYFDAAGEPFSLVRLRDLGIPNLPRFRFHYDRKQVAVAAKPYLLSHLLDRGLHSAILLDPDMLVLGSLDSLAHHVSRHAVVLTPHTVARGCGPGSRITVSTPTAVAGSAA